MIANPHSITRQFEAAISEYTGAPYVVCVDSGSNALFLALLRSDVRGKSVEIPCRTYMSVPCEIIHAGASVKFYPVEGTTLKGAYQLKNTPVWDSALKFTADMYQPGTYMCCSFTGAYKRLKLGKGGCILTDNKQSYEWFKRARFSGRRECSYHDDFFDMLGWNFYMNPLIATLGLQQMPQFYAIDGSKLEMPDLELPYPDLSRFNFYQLHSGPTYNQLYTYDGFFAEG